MERGTAVLALMLSCVLATTLAALPASAQSISAESKTKAEAGDLASQLALANAYLKGKGFQKNDDLAFKWFLAAAENGDVKAEVQVAVMYWNGIGVNQDKAAAVPWYAKAAWQGDASARYNLAVAYYNGDGIGINDWLAYAWFALAKEAGDPQAAEAVSRTESEHTPQWIADARLRLAKMLEKGDGVKPDPSAAAAHYRDVLAVEGKAPATAAEAHLQLGVMQIEGRGVPRNLALAQNHCKAAVDNGGLPQGYACLGYLALNAEGGPNYDEAFRMFRKAADRGHLASIFKLGELYEKGQGVKVDGFEAAKYYAIAARHSYAGAQEALDRMMNRLSDKQKKKLAELAKPAIRR